MALRVMIVDDHRLMLEAVRIALEGAPDIVVVGQTAAGAEAVSLVAETNPDVVLLDYRMPDLDGLTCLERLRRRYPALKVVMLSAVDDPGVIEAALARGASAFILKDIDAADLAPVLRQVAEGTVHQTFGLRRREPAPPTGPTLTSAQDRVLKALARGLSNKGIAKELWLSEQTVKFHLSNIYRALGVSSRSEAIRYAYEHGLADALSVESAG